MTYDCVYSLGQWCATALYMKRFGLRSCSGPFDWTGPNTALSVYIDIICSGFAGYMAKENLRFDEVDPIEGTEHYVDVTTGLRTHHEFRVGVDFETNYRNYHEMLMRRAERLLKCLERGERMLLVQFHGEGRYEPDVVCDSVRRLRKKYPSARIDLLLLESENRHVGLTREKLADGIVRVTGDFYDRSRFDPVLGNEPILCSVFRGIRMRGRWRNLLRQRIESVKKRLARHFGGR